MQAHPLEVLSGVSNDWYVAVSYTHLDVYKRQVVLFVVLYFGYNWFKHSQINKLENIDLDSGRREMDSIIWKEDVDYSLSLKEFFYKILSYI